MTRRRADMQHGDLTMYTYRKCRCDLCRAARAAYNADLRQRNREKQVATPAPEKASNVAVCTIPTAHLRGWR